MPGSGIDAGLAARSGLFYFLAEVLQYPDRNQFVSVPQKHDRRRSAFGNVMSRGEFPVTAAGALVTPGSRAIVENRIEEHEGIRPAVDLEIILRVVQSRYQRREGCQMSPRGTTGSGDASRIHPQLRGMRAYITHRRFGVRTADQGRPVVAFGDGAVFHAETDHAPRGEIGALGPELFRRAPDPPPAKEKYDSRPLIRRRPARWFFHQYLHIPALHFFVNDGFRGR